MFRLALWLSFSATFALCLTQVAACPRGVCSYGPETARSCCEGAPVAPDRSDDPRPAEGACCGNPGTACRCPRLSDVSLPDAWLPFPSNVPPVATPIWVPAQRGLVCGSALCRRPRTPPTDPSVLTGVLRL